MTTSSGWGASAWRATSDNFSLSAQLTLQLVSDIGGKGNLVVFNGFAGVPVCEIRRTQLKTVLKN